MNTKLKLNNLEELFEDFQDAIDRVVEGPTSELDKFHQVLKGQTTELLEALDTVLRKCAKSAEILERYLSGEGISIRPALSILEDLPSVTDEAIRKAKGE